MAQANKRTVDECVNYISSIIAVVYSLDQLYRFLFHVLIVSAVISANEIWNLTRPSSPLHSRQ